jgi:hypothetical protein
LVLGTFFQGYVSGEEKMKRIEDRLACTRFFPPPEYSLTPLLVAEHAFDKDPSLPPLTVGELDKVW